MKMIYCMYIPCVKTSLIWRNKDYLIWRTVIRKKEERRWLWRRKKRRIKRMMLTFYYYKNIIIWTESSCYDLEVITNSGQRKKDAEAKLIMKNQLTSLTSIGIKIFRANSRPTLNLALHVPNEIAEKQLEDLIASNGIDFEIPVSSLRW